MHFPDICWCRTLICLLTYLLADRDCLNPPDQTELLIYSGQNCFLINFRGNFISSCAEPTKTLTITRQRCHFMNIQSQKTLPRVTSYPTSSLVAPAPAACTSHQGFLWAPSHGLLPSTALWMNWFGSLCSVLTFSLKMYSGLWTHSLDQHCPANEMDFSAVVFSFAFSQLTSPTFSLLPGLPHCNNYCNSKKRARVTNCCLSSSLWFPKTSCSGFRHSPINKQLTAQLLVPTHTNKPTDPHTGACHVPLQWGKEPAGWDPPSQQTPRNFFPPKNELTPPSEIKQKGNACSGNVTFPKQSHDSLEGNFQGM